MLGLRGGVGVVSGDSTREASIGLSLPSKYPILGEHTILQLYLGVLHVLGLGT